jgi:hypothetical protein
LASTACKRYELAVLPRIGVLDVATPLLSLQCVLSDPPNRSLAMGTTTLMIP